MKEHTCPHCGEAVYAHGSRKHHSCGMCGGSFSSFLKSAVSMGKKIASNPLVQQIASSALNKYAPGVAKRVNQAVGAYNRVASNPLGQAALGAVRSRVGLGRRRRGAMLPLGQMSPGEAAYAQMRASGRYRKRGGKGMAGMAEKAEMVGQVASLIPGAAEALGPFGALFGMSPPPPPPPHATFSAVRAGPMEAARAHGIGRGKKCGMCGGFGFGDLLKLGQQVASNPLVRDLASSALDKYAPGVSRRVNQAVGAYNRVASNPLGQAALGAVRSRVGLGRRTRAPTAHSVAVGRVMRESGMGLAEASRYVKQNGLAH